MIIISSIIIIIISFAKSPAKIISVYFFLCRWRSKILSNVESQLRSCTSKAAFLDLQARLPCCGSRLTLTEWVVIKFHLNSTMVSNAKVWTCRFPLLSFQPMEVFACFLKDYPPLGERGFGLQAVKDMSLPVFLIQDGSFACSSWLTPIHSIHTGMTFCNWNQHSQLTGVATSFQRKATPPHWRPPVLAWHASWGMRPRGRSTTLT